MRRLAIATALVLVVMSSGVRGAQSPQPVAPTMRRLAGTWTLVSIARLGANGLTSLPLPRGLLVLDSAGHIFEGVQHGRQQGAPALGERQLAFATFSGFWGTYTVDGPATAAGRSLTIKTRGAVHPNPGEAGER